MSKCVQFRDKVVVQGRVKCFAQVRVDDTSKIPEYTKQKQKTKQKNRKNYASGLCVHECQKKCSLFYFSSLHFFGIQYIEFKSLSFYSHCLTDAPPD